MATPTRICHLTSVHLALDTRIFFKECVSLSSEYEVHLIAINPKDETRKNVKIHGLNKPPNRFFRIAFTDFQLLFKAIKVNASLYHFHDPELIPYALILRLLGKKVIYDVHENVFADLSEKQWLPFKKLFKKLYRFFERSAAQKFGIVLANQEYVAHYDSLGAHYAVVQNFLLLDTLKNFQKTEYGHENTVLMVGYLTANRALPQIIRAIARIKNEYAVNIRLKCIGQKTQELSEMLENVPEYSGIKNQVEFPGFIPFESAYQSSNECFAGLAILDKVENNLRNYSTKMFEYMAVGLPVIVSDFPHNRQILEKERCALFVNPDSVDGIAYAIHLFFTNRALAAEMGKNGAAISGRFSWKTEEKKLLDFYKRILN